LEALLSDFPQERLLTFLRERGVIGADADYQATLRVSFVACIPPESITSGSLIA
jgi:hypothetical protein